MATDDVPGANPANRDKLSRGCWAEHADGSMVFVKDIDENDRVIFEMFDFADSANVVFYSDAQPKVAFESLFTYRPKDKKSIRWTWHDKTPFPWDKVMKHVKSPAPARPASDTLSAAARVADSLKKRGLVLDEAHVDELRGSVEGRTRFKRAAQHMMEGFTKAMAELGSEG